jgi:hypothetical protein
MLTQNRQYKTGTFKTTKAEKRPYLTQELEKTEELTLTVQPLKTKQLM